LKVVTGRGVVWGDAPSPEALRPPFGAGDGDVFAADAF
jgi:hypothetical protein